jgi:hypothetical protein
MTTDKTTASAVAAELDIVLVLPEEEVVVPTSGPSVASGCGAGKLRDMRFARLNAGVYKAILTIFS